MFEGFPCGDGWFVEVDQVFGVVACGVGAVLRVLVFIGRFSIVSNVLKCP